MAQIYIFDRFTATLTYPTITIKNTAPVLLTPPSDITIPVGLKATVQLGQAEDAEGDKISVDEVITALVDNKWISFSS